MEESDISRIKKEITELLEYFKYLERNKLTRRRTKADLRKYNKTGIQ